MSDDLQPLVKALRRKVNHQEDTINTQEDMIDALEERVAELERLVDPDPGSTEYDQLTKSQKVHRVRKHLVEEADKGNVPAMKYKDVKWLFDGHPSAGHCYDLMEQAGQLDGFAYETGGHGKGEKRIRVNLEAVKDETLLHAVNNAPDETPA